MKTLYLLRNDSGDLLGIFNTEERAEDFAVDDMIRNGFNPEMVSVHDLYLISKVGYYQ